MIAEKTVDLQNKYDLIRDLVLNYKQAKKDDELKQQDQNNIQQQPNQNSNLSQSQNIPIHHGVRCDGCGISPIVGIRYKCQTCHNFDYCAKCEEANALTHDHPFIKFYKPRNGYMFH